MGKRSACYPLRYARSTALKVLRHSEGMYNGEHATDSTRTVAYSASRLSLKTCARESHFARVANSNRTRGRAGRTEP